MSSALPRFIFIIGASGSGTTMLSRILSRSHGCVSLGGNNITVPESNQPARLLVDRFNALTTDLWDRHAEQTTVDEARRQLPLVYTELFGLPGMRHVTHAIYKRSAPFLLGDRHRPDLSDLFGLFADVMIVAVYRDPCASAASSFRRGFAPSLRQCAVIAEEQLTYMSAQLATLPPERITALSYEDFCQRPTHWIDALAGTLELDREALHAGLAAEQVDASRNDRWRQDLSKEDAASLIAFFDARRRNQWPLLEATRRDLTRRSTAAHGNSGADSPANKPGVMA